MGACARGTCSEHENESPLPMIRDAKHPVLTPLIGRYITWKLKRAFRGLWLKGALPDSDAPLILYANHSSFWDGFITHAVAQHFRRDGYAVMEEQNLARYRFLSRLGAVSIRRHDKSSALETLRYLKTLLQRPRAAVVLFPQGQQQPDGLALKFERGIEVLARMTNAQCVPLAYRYAFFEHEYPDVLIAAGAPHGAIAADACAARVEQLRGELSAIDVPASSLTPLLAGRRSVADRWDTARGLSPRSTP